MAILPTQTADSARTHTKTKWNRCVKLTAEEEILQVKRYQSAQREGAKAAAHCPGVISHLLKQWHHNELPSGIKRLVLGNYTQESFTIQPILGKKRTKSQFVSAMLRELEYAYHSCTQTGLDCGGVSAKYLEVRDHLETSFAELRFTSKFRDEFYAIPHTMLSKCKRSRQANFGVSEQDLQDICECIKCSLVKAVSARNKIIESIYPMIIGLTHKLARGKVELDELVSVGVLAAYRALEIFELNRDCRFGSFASWEMYYAIQDALLSANHDSTLICIDTLPEEFVDTKAPTAMDIVLKHESCTVLRNAVANLPDEQAQVIQLYFGLTKAGTLTYQQIATTLDLTVSRVRYLAQSGLSKLRKLDTLRDYFA